MFKLSYPNDFKPLNIFRKKNTIYNFYDILNNFFFYFYSKAHLRNKPQKHQQHHQQLRRDLQTAVHHVPG